MFLRIHHKVVVLSTVSYFSLIQLMSISTASCERDVSACVGNIGLIECPEYVIYCRNNLNQLLDTYMQRQNRDTTLHKPAYQLEIILNIFHIKLLLIIAQQ